MLTALEVLPDFDILSAFEDALREKSLEHQLGYFSGELFRDNDGVKIVLRVAAMVDSAGMDDFVNNPALNSILVDWPEGPVDFRVTDSAPVSGMEIEVVYRPFEPEV